MALTRPRALQIFDLDYKQAVRVTTTSNVTLSGGAPSTVDGVALALNDRILVNGQGTASQNGIYEVATLGTGVNGSWVRTVDAAANGTLLAGAIVMVTEGTVFADTQFKLITNGPIVIGTTALNFEQNSAFAFGNIFANGTAVLANSVGDTLTLSTGNNISITGNATTKSVTVAVVDSPNFTGTLNVTGNATVGNLDTAGQVVSTGNVSGGNLTTAGVVLATGNVSGGNVVAASAISAGTTINATGNITGGNVVTAGVVDSNTLSVTGNANVGNLGTAGEVVATGNVSGGNVTTAGVVSATGNITGGNVVTAGVVDSNTLSVTGNANVGNLGTAGEVVATGNVSGGNLVTAGLVSATGNVSGGNLVTAGLVDAGSITSTTTIAATGNVSGGNLVTAGLTSTGTLVATGNISGGNLTTAGETFTGTLRSTGDALINGNLTVQGNLTYINIEDLRVQDPVIVLGTGPNGAPLTQNDGLDRGVYMEYYTTETANAFMGFQNASGNMIIANDVDFASNDVIQVNSFGTFQAGNAYLESANVLGNITAGNITTSGTLSTTGNLSANNLSATNSITAGTTIVATGNVSGGNVVTVGVVDSGTLSVTGNANVGNLGTAGQISATGNVSGGNVVTAGLVDAGSITSTTTIVATGNVSGGNVVTAGLVDAGSITSTTTIAATGNVSGGNLTTAGLASSNTLTVTGNANVGNLGTAGEVVATGNVSGGNLVTAGLVDAGSITSTTTIAATGNVSGGNVTTVGQVTATGNVSGGNLVTAGLVDAGSITSTTTIDATGNVSGGNLTTLGQVTATGNVSGGNVVTAGVVDAGSITSTTTIDATGNVSGGNLTTVGQVTATGNVSGGNLVTAGTVSSDSLTAVGNITGGNLISLGTVSATGNVSGNFFIGNGRFLSGIDTTLISNGTSEVRVYENGNIAFTVGGVANVAVVTDTGINVAGNVSSGNINTVGQVFATGNVSGGNIDTVGQIFATGNIQGGNVLAANLTGTLLTVNQPNITDVGTLNNLDVAGNIVSNTATIGNITISDSNINSDASAISINSNNADVDFVVNGDTTANIFYVDAGTETVSIGNSTQTASATLSINSTNSLLMPRGNTAQRPSGTIGMVRYNTETDGLEQFTQDGWKPVGTEFTVIDSETFAGDNSTVAFTLATAQTTNSCIISINGIVQEPLTAYSVTGTTLTFTEAPLDGDTIEVRALTTTVTAVSISNSNGNARVAVTDTSNDVTVTGDLIPAANVTFDLGSASARWNELFLAGNTIVLGDVVIKNTGGNTIGFFGPDGTTPGTIDTDNIDSAGISNGTSSLAVVASGGNIQTTINGNTVGVFAASGLVVTGSIEATNGFIGLDASAIANGSANVRTFQNANVTISAGGATDVLVVTGTGANVTGTLTATGNISGANIVTTGNIVAGNLVVAGIESVGTLNVSGNTLISGNLTVSGTTFTANVTSLVVTDPILGLGRGANGAPLTTNDGLDRGVEMFYFTDAEQIAFVGYDNSAGKMVSAANVSVANNLITVNSFGTTVVGTLETSEIIKTGANGVGNIGAADSTFNVVFARATSALYADLAEQYLADAEYGPGTVLVFGGSAEVTSSATNADHRVAGVVSTNPGYIMNAGLAGDHVVLVALTGRVPCQVIGPVSKGDLMVSAANGHAQSDNLAQAGTIIGKALEDFDGIQGVIEVVVGKH